MMHSRQDIVRQVKQIVADQLHVAVGSLSSASSFAALGADSLGVLKLTLTFEEAFEIDIEDDMVETLATVGQAVEYIEFHAAKTRRA